MSIFSKVFGKNKNAKDPSQKQKAIIFIDYEHWFYSYTNYYKTKPDPLEWKKKIESKYDIQKIMVFADFSEKEIKYELQPLRQITNLIIETHHANLYTKKDMTDFIMLDSIYQSVDDQDSPDTYIIFTGDGHFQSVVKYLIHKKKKKVIIYGVKQATSKQLAAVASECIQIPNANEFFQQHVDMVLNNLYRLSGQKQGQAFPTFMKTVEVVSSYNSANPEHIKSALSDLINKGYIKSKMVKPSADVEFKSLVVNWEKVYADGVWSSPIS